MKTYNDKIFFGVGCGGCMGTPRSVYTSLNKDGNTIELFETLYDRFDDIKRGNNKYTFKYNGAIYDLIKVEKIK